MNALDPFALGGRQGDSHSVELVQAGRRFAALLARWRGQISDDERADLADELLTLMDFIDAAEPASLGDCAITLVVLGSKEKLTEDDERSDRVASMRKVLAYIEREIAGDAT